MKSFTKKSLSLLALSMTGALAFGSFVGCSGDDDDSNPTTGGDASTDGSTTKLDGAVKTDAATDAGPGSSDAGDAGDSATAGPTTLREGFVSFLQEASTNVVGTSYIKSASAIFLEVPASSALVTCTAPQTFGSCTYVDCTQNPASDAGTDAGTDAGGDAGPTTFDTGLITLTGGSGFPTGGIVLTPAGTADTYSVTAPANFATDIMTQYIKSGDQIAFTSAGNQSSIGTFTSTLAAATDVTFSTPAFTGTLGAQTTSFPRNADLAVTWGSNAAIGSSIVASVAATTKATGEVQTISCTFAAAGSPATIPTAALAKFPNVDGTAVTGRATFTPETTATVLAGNNGGASSASDAWKITTTVTAAATSGTFTTTN